MEDAEDRIANVKSRGGMDQPDKGGTDALSRGGIDQPDKGGADALNQAEMDVAEPK